MEQAITEELTRAALQSIRVRVADGSPKKTAPLRGFLLWIGAWKRQGLWFGATLVQLGFWDYRR